MSKLSFRARALDASKPMPIFMAEELPDLPEYSAINRAVPQMPSGMEKEEECEHHLQRAICAGLIIPTPEVSEADHEAYDKLYPPNYKQPRQLIHMQPLVMEQDIPDYDMDSEDERWLVSQAKKLDLAPLKFEEMMDRLEKSSGQTVITLNEAKALLKEDDDLIIAVFDYWLNKRLKTQQPLILSVKTEHRMGLAANNPYLAFRRRTEKMQTRKNRKNDETSYEKMIKLKRDLTRAVTLLELVKRREKSKREHLHLTIEICEKRYQAQDFSGALLAEIAASKASRPAFTQLFQNHYSNPSWVSKTAAKEEIVPRKEKRQYKKRKHKNSTHGGRLPVIPGSGMDGVSSDEDEVSPPQPSPEPEETVDEGPFAFRRNKLCNYHMPIPNGMGNWPWCGPEENGIAERKYRYTLTSLAHPRRCIGFARRRMGRGGRVILDRASTDHDDFWRQLDFTIYDNAATNSIKSPAAKLNATSTMTTTNTSQTLTAEQTSWTTTNKDLLSSFATSGGDATTNVNTNLLRNSSNSCNSSSSSSNINSSSTVSNSAHSSWQTSSNSLLASEVCSSSDLTKSEIKKEIVDRTEVVIDVLSATCPEKSEYDENLEFLQEMRRDGWLHFRPKTPPPSYDDSTSSILDELSTTTATALTIELQNLSPCPLTLLDDSLFTTEPFTLQDICPTATLVNDNTVPPPYDDTRQASLTAAAMETNIVTDMALDRSFGCSRFSVVNSSSNSNNFSSDLFTSSSSSSSSSVHNNSEKTVDFCVTTPNKKQSILSSTLTSPKYNSVNVSSSTSSTLSTTLSSAYTCSSLDNRPKQQTIANHVSNGPLSHTELISSGRKGNKMQHNAYTSGMSSARGCNATSTTSTLNSERSSNTRFATQHTTVTTHNTLNSHSANNMDITSLPNSENSGGDSTTTTKMLNLQYVDNNMTGTTNTTATTNNKQPSNNKQTIVRKNNILPMEVT